MPEYEKDANELEAKFKDIRDKINELEAKLDKLEAMESRKPYRIPFMHGERW